MRKLRDILLRWDRPLARFELALAAACIGALVLCMGLGTGARSLGRPVVFSDDLSVALMVWAALFAISANLATAGHMRVDLFWPRLPHGLRRAVDLAGFALVLGFVISLWRWLDPVGLWQAGDPMALAMATGNYTYTEPAMTLGLLKVWLWLPMVPAGICALFHSLVRVIAPAEGCPC